MTTVEDDIELITDSWSDSNIYEVGTNAYTTVDFNNTYGQNGPISSLAGSFTFVEVLGLMLMIAVTVVAVIANTSILFVIARSPQLRSQLAFLHLLNMCVIHILGSCLVLPISIRHFSQGYWSFGASYCQAHQFFLSFFSYSAILSMCVISIERYYSIRAPMHYAVHVTLGRTIGVIIGQHLYTALVSAIPFFVPQPVVTRPDWNCSPRSEQLVGFHRVYIYILGLVCFLIPAFVMLTMYSLVYKVAKQAARRIHPLGRVDNFESHPGVVPNGTDKNRPSVKSDSADKENPIKRHREEAIPTCFVVAPPEVNSTMPTTEPSPVNESASSSIHWKAIKTLFLIITAFLIFWGPHFLLKLVQAANGTTGDWRGFAIFFQWLGWVSYAVNPFIYGGLNRTVREELYSQWERLKSCLKKEESGQVGEDSEMGVPGENEDFFQFLERTTVGYGKNRVPSDVESQSNIDRDISVEGNTNQQV